MANIDREPWSVRESDFPARGSLGARLTFLLRYAILAPSARNTQPWRFTIAGSRINLHADLARWTTCSADSFLFLQRCGAGRERVQVEIGRAHV